MNISQLTILRNHTGTSCTFTLIFQDFAQHTNLLHELAYEEMLGAIAKMFCPPNPGEPPYGPKRLFLGAPDESVTKTEEQAGNQPTPKPEVRFP